VGGVPSIEGDNGVGSNDGGAWETVWKKYPAWRNVLELGVSMAQEWSWELTLLFCKCENICSVLLLNVSIYPLQFIEVVLQYYSGPIIGLGVTRLTRRFVLCKRGH